MDVCAVCEFWELILGIILHMAYKMCQNKMLILPMVYNSSYFLWFDKSSN